MLINRDIIIFGDDWRWYPSTIQHIGRILAKQNRVFWVGSLGLRKPKFQIYDLRRFFIKGKNILFKNKRKENLSPVIQIHPFVIPFHDIKFVRIFNVFFLKRLLNKKIKQYNIINPILITSNPIISELLGTLGETSSHYICLDDFTKFDRAFKSLSSFETKLLEKVDTSFSISQALLSTRVPKSGLNYFLPQGVDTNHFIKSNVKPPQSIANLKKPIIGYFGLLTTWVDVQLIIKVAKYYENASILIFGRSNIDTSIFSSYKNIYYLGEIPYEILPDYASFFDVGLIPFIVNDLTIAANPLKLLEYFALSIPVVSTKLPEVEKFSKYVYIAPDKKEFVNLIKIAIEEDSEKKQIKRREIADKHSWDQITEYISNKIITIEKRKN